MPTLSSMVIPPPKDWSEFEEITLSALKIKWQSPNLQRNGRKGQGQNGVDIYGPDNLGRFVGIQCKRYEKKLTFKLIQSEIKNAEDFTPIISTFFIATTNNSDSLLQQKIRILSEERCNDHKFPVGIFFWEDLIQELIKNHEEFRKHYPQLVGIADQFKQNGARLISLLDLGYLGVYLNFHFEVLFGEIGMLVEDPTKYFILYNSLMISSNLLLDNERSSELNELLIQLNKFMKTYIFGNKIPKNGWQPAKYLVRKIAYNIIGCENLFYKDDLIAFNIGKLLGSWDKLEWNDKNFQKNEQDTLIKYLMTVLKLNDNDKFIKKVSSLVRKSSRKNHPGVELLPNKTYYLIKIAFKEKDMLG